MKRLSREWNSIDVLVAVAALCAAVIVAGLLSPALRPLATLMGYAVCITVALTSLGILIYVTSRIILFAARKSDSLSTSRSTLSE